MDCRTGRLVIGWSLFALIGCDDPTATERTRAIAISTPSAYLDVGQTLQLSAIAKDGVGSTLEGARVTWASSNPAVATVADGNVTGRAVGSAYIKATAGAATDSVQLTVEAPIAELVVWPRDTLHLIRGRAAGLRIEMRDRDGQGASHSYVVSSSNPGILFVDGTTLTSGSLGEAVVTVTAGLKSVRVPVRVVTGERYRVTQLDALAGEMRVPSAINNLGWIVGSTYKVGSSQSAAFLWRAGKVTEIGPSWYGNARVALSDSGWIAGTASGEAWAWRNGVLRILRLDSFPVANTREPAVWGITGISNSGQVVGLAAAYYQCPSRNCATSHRAFSWKEGSLTWIAPERVESPAGISNSGWIALNSQRLSRPAPDPAYLWRQGELVAISPLALEGFEAYTLQDINDRHQVVGRYWLNSNGILFVWEHGSVRTLDYARNLTPQAINNYGDIVGYTYGPHPYLARDGHLLDLRAATEASEWLVESPSDINDLGQIVALGTHKRTGERNGLLLTPTN